MMDPANRMQVLPAWPAEWCSLNGAACISRPACGHPGADGASAPHAAGHQAVTLLALAGTNVPSACADMSTLGLFRPSLVRHAQD